MGVSTCILMSICQILQFLKIKHIMVTPWDSSGFDMKLECSKDKPVVSCKGLSTPKNPAVLENPPVSANKNVIDLHSYTSGIAIPSPSMSLWPLVPRVCSYQPFGSRKTQTVRTVSVPGTRAMGTHINFAPGSLSASGSIKVTKDNECPERV